MSRSDKLATVDNNARSVADYVIYVSVGIFLLGAEAEDALA
jgi:hypothetical protein